MIDINNWSGDDYLSLIDSMFAYELSTLTEQEWEIDNRAKWKDGSQVMTKRIIQSFNHYDLTEGFPILALREINYKAAIDEAIWVFIQMSNNTNDLNSTIWRSWENEKNEIAYAYGHQIAKPTMGHPSQMHYVINEIKTNPTSRRIMMNMYSAEEQHLKGLIECAYSTHFSVKNGNLHMTLIQRSGDAIVAAGIGSWNVVQYAFLQHAIAKECGLIAGDFTHFVQDLHIYNKHEEQAEEARAHGHPDRALPVGEDAGGL
jgi:thymidylate synthase